MVIAIVIIAYFMIGVGALWLDHKLMERVFTKKTEKRLIIGRGTWWRVTAAVLIIIILNMVFSFFFSNFEKKSPEEAVGYWLLELVAIVVGFYLGPHVLKVLPGKMKIVSDYAAKMGKGDANPVEDLKNSLKKGEKELVRTAVDHVLSDDKKSGSEKTEKPENPPIKKEEPKTPGKRPVSGEDLLESVKKFTHGNNHTKTEN
jgi:hypothetical protein